MRPRAAEAKSLALKNVEHKVRGYMYDMETYLRDNIEKIHDRTGDKIKLRNAATPFIDEGKLSQGCVTSDGVEVGAAAVGLSCGSSTVCSANDYYSCGISDSEDDHVHVAAVAVAADCAAASADCFLTVGECTALAATTKKDA